MLEIPSAQLVRGMSNGEIAVVRQLLSVRRRHGHNLLKPEFGHTVDDFESSRLRYFWGRLGRTPGPNLYYWSGVEVLEEYFI